jgi:AcrR family transcriptional regulator
VIAEQGLAMLTMERVSAQAGVSKPVLYTHFDNRAALLVGLLEEFWSEVDGRLADSTRRSRLLTAFSADLITAFFDVIQRGGSAIQQILTSGSEEPEVEAARRERFHQVEAIWSTMYQKHLGLPPASADIAAAILRSAIAGAGAHWIAHPDVGRQTCVDVCLCVVNGALKQLQGSAA